MMKRLQLFIGVVLLLVLPTLGFAQAALTQTTLAANVTTASANTIRVTSATGFTAGNLAFVDHEAMRVTDASGTAIGVIRGMNGTVAERHTLGATIYVGPQTYFTTSEQTGRCTSTGEVVLPLINTVTGDQFQCYNSRWSKVQRQTFWTDDLLTVEQGVSPSYKNIYARTIVPAAVTGGTQAIRGIQSAVTLNTTSAPGEVFGMYGLLSSAGSPVSLYGVVGEVDITASTPSNAAFGTLGTYDGVVSITATPVPATGPFSAAVAGQVWDRNTDGPTAIILALANGDANRQAAHPIGAAFKAINRHISFATGFNYAFDSFVEAGFVRGALIADIRLGSGSKIMNGVGAPAAGTCITANLGSLYLNISGGANTSLYVCQVAGGWTAVTP